MSPNDQVQFTKKLRICEKAVTEMEKSDVYGRLLFQGKQMLGDD